MLMLTVHKSAFPLVFWLKEARPYLRCHYVPLFRIGMHTALARLASMASVILILVYPLHVRSSTTEQTLGADPELRCDLHKSTPLFLIPTHNDQCDHFLLQTT